jgi:hypothetical protein
LIANQARVHPNPFPSKLRTSPEAVSLSLNIDPRKLGPHPAGGGFAGIAIFRIPPPEFYHRLDLAVRCVGETLPAAKSRYGKEHIRLYSFTAWATGLGWDLPSELEALARELELSSNMDKSGPEEPTPEPIRVKASTAGLALSTGNDKPEPTPKINRLAEWIFRMRRDERSFKKLYNIARKKHQLGTFTKADFLKAYQAVCMTKAHHPPASGWPLQAAYQKHAEDEMNVK